MLVSCARKKNDVHSVHSDVPRGKSSSSNLSPDVICAEDMYICRHRTSVRKVVHGNRSRHARNPKGQCKISSMQTVCHAEHDINKISAVLWCTKSARPPSKRSWSKPLYVAVRETRTPRASAPPRGSASLHEDSSHIEPSKIQAAHS